MDTPNKSRTRPKKTTRTVLSEVAGPLLLSSRPALDSNLGDVDSNLGDVDSTGAGLELPFESTARERRVAIAAERATYLLICRSEISLNLVGYRTGNKPKTSVGDPDPEPDPQDPHVFGPPGSGSISRMYGSGSGSGSFFFLINVWSGLK